MRMPAYGHEYAAVRPDDAAASADFDDSAPIFAADAPPPSWHAGKKAAAVLVVCALAAVAGAQQYHATAHVTLLADEDAALKISNEYERKRGFALADGALGLLAQVHKPTKLKLAGRKPVVWRAETSPGSGVLAALNGGKATATLEHTFTEAGAHAVHAQELAFDGAVAATHAFTVTAKVIRYELRDLDDGDRQAYFDALHQFYALGQTEGEALYGSDYKSISFLVREHLYGGADKACDHWHDDAGILNHHIGVTWTMEQSLRTINPKTAAHYWDYTREEGQGVSWFDSPVFGDDWFGSNSPANADHVVDSGRFAYTPVMTDAAAFSSITNPYGLLRSPWNTDPTPYLRRSNRTFFGLGDGFTAFPSCANFKTTLETQSLAQALYKLNGQLHGPVHLMVGGHWGSNKDWSALGKNAVFDDKFLLLSKWFWRLGFVRTPETCSSDTAHADCMPTCPMAILAPGNVNHQEDGSINSDNALQILSDAGLFSLSQSEANWEKYMEEYGDGDLDWLSLLDEICHVGTAGEMFTSSAPQDPLFWPLHGNAERFVMYLRVLNEKGTISLDETWGYVHGPDVPSDTGMVCDWDDVTDVSDMPKCTRETCPGHKEDDMLPFRHLFKAQGNKYLTNREMYHATSPYSADLPYMYDSLSYWEGCSGHSLLNADDDQDDARWTFWAEEEEEAAEAVEAKGAAEATAAEAHALAGRIWGVWGAMRR